MNTQSVEQLKSKANGKYQEVKSEEIMQMAQDKFASLVDEAPKFAKTYGNKAVKWARENPKQAGIAGVALALFLGRRLFATKKA
jgi:ElaB/YqjD/DUF883 family membrane-anchored ribosome-binding protein